jgi:Family of unknown function (DUF5995)
MLTDILLRTPARSIDDVVGLMTAIDESLPDEDGLKWFNRLYLRVTVSVRKAVEGTTFRDPAFLAQLDVVFANLYFAALTAAGEGGAGAPAAWRPLLDARHQRGIARIQFALAGMNAHINRDLPEGIVQTFKALGGDPRTDRGRRQDFDSINALLERVEQEVRTDFSVGIVGVIDELGHDVDDAVAMWKVRAARAAAWTNAKVMWTLRDAPALHDEFFERLDGLTGLAGRGLLRRAVLKVPSG